MRHHCNADPDHWERERARFSRVGALWRVDQRLGMPRNGGPATRQVGPRKAMAPRKWGAKCFGRGGWGGGMGCLAPHCRAATIGTCLDAVVPLFTRASTVEIPVASTSRRRWRKTVDRRKWVHEVWVGHTLAKGVENTVGRDAQRWAYFCQSSNERKGRETGALCSSPPPVVRVVATTEERSNSMGRF